jgi:hypothetical protein
VHGVHADAEGAQLDRRRLRHAADRELGAGVRGEGRHAGQSLDRRAVDDRALTVRLHRGGDGPHAEEGAAQVDVEQEVEVLQRHRVDLAEPEHARVVDQHVHGGTEVLLGLRDQPVPGGRVADVVLHERRDVAELVGQRRPGVDGHVGEHHPCALADERARDGRALALGAAGDDGVLVLESRHGSSPRG